MRTKKQILEERAEKYNSVEALVNKRKAENRNWTAEEAAEFDAAEARIQELDTELQAVDKEERAALMIAARSAGQPIQGKFSDKEERDLDKYSLRKVMLSKLEGRGLDGIEAEMHEEGKQERIQAGASVDTGYIIPDSVLSRLAIKHLSKRAVTATGGSGAQGGHNIATDVMGYVEILRERSLILQLGAQYLTGMVGNFQMPRENAVFRPGWKAENAATDVTSPTFTKADFTPKRLTGEMEISLQFLRQVSPAVEGYLLQQIILGHAEAIDFAGFAGPTGGASPVGILYDSDVAVTEIGANGGAITQVILDTLDQALRGRKQYGQTNIVTTAKIRRVLRNLPIASGSDLFVWDRRDNNIDGKPAFDTTHLPDNLTKGDSSGICSALIEGVFADSMFAQWGGTEILNDPYTKASNGLVRMVSHQYVDFHVTRPASFQVVKDITVTP